MKSFILAALAATAVAEAAALPAEDIVRLSKRQGIVPIAGLTSMSGKSVKVEIQSGHECHLTTIEEREGRSRILQAQLPVGRLSS